jgi:hypothetical protein
MGEDQQAIPLNEQFENERKEIKGIASNVKSLIGVVKTGSYAPETDQGEMIANLMLAYRHLEDASMRLGKAIQAFDGGKSVYDKNTVIGA